MHLSVIQPDRLIIFKVKYPFSLSGSAVSNCTFESMHSAVGAKIVERVVRED